MHITKRTKISLAQLLDKLDKSDLKLLFEKYEMDNDFINVDDIKNIVLSSTDLSELIKEVIERKQTFRNKIITKYPFDDRFSDFEKYLFLDGYKIENNSIIQIEPTIDGVVAFEDELTKEIDNSTFSKKDEIKRLINESAEAFKNSDFNGCLSKARISLETIVRTIAIDKYSNTDDRWANALINLKTNGFLAQKEEELFAKVYKFIIDASHIHLGFTDKEYARYGRNLAMSKCYYIIKIYKQNF
ncbi:hypothetical protein [Arcobacter vandammei]|uniref:hypothetical protein n=1 Tax=Arcobacter vandammei TaxID=2782243 RepID=UPI0018DF93C3|nr:hypothetical protein [Arcobacter vandammei]